METQSDQESYAIQLGVNPGPAQGQMAPKQLSIPDIISSVDELQAKISDEVGRLTVLYGKIYGNGLKPAPGLGQPNPAYNPQQAQGAGTTPPPVMDLAIASIARLRRTADRLQTVADKLERLSD